MCCEVYSYYEQAFDSCCRVCYVLYSINKAFLVECAIRFIPIMNKHSTIAVVSVMHKHFLVEYAVSLFLL